MTLKDKNDKEIKKTEIPGDFHCSYLSSNDKYFAIQAFTKYTKSNKIDIYSLPDLNKISSL